MTSFSFSRRPSRPPAKPRLDKPPAVGYCCPSCGATKTNVRDSRSTPEGHIRRRRVCVSCDHRFHTIELVEGIALPPTREAKLLILEEFLPEMLEYMKVRLP